MIIDHILAFVSDTGDEVRDLEAAGFLSGRKAIHSGQGTQNTCFAFDIPYLELVWATPGAIIDEAVVAPTALPDRCKWWQKNGCPFGFAIRLEETETTLPFDTWTYRPPYDANQPPIYMSTTTPDPRQPLMFIMPILPRDPNHKPQTKLGIKKLTGCILTHPADHPVSPALQALADSGLLELRQGPAWHMTLVGDHGAQGKRYACKLPRLPLSFSW